MKFFVTGAAGQLGRDVIAELNKRGFSAVGCDIAESCDFAPYITLDITDAAAVEQALTHIRPDVVIHCAAWTAVDLGEEPANAAKVRAVNVDGTRNIAQVCKAIDCKMIYISTDYIFSGLGDTPWTPDDVDCAPVNLYGQTKLEGEQVVASLLEKYFIVRISWVFGMYGKNFIKTTLNLGKTHDSIQVVCDQIGRPTYTPDLSRLLVDMALSDQYGYYHATNEGDYVSWYEFACQIYKMAGHTAEVVPVTTADYGLRKANRPLNSRLDTSKLTRMGFTPLPTWQDALQRYLKELEVI